VHANHILQGIVRIAHQFCFPSYRPYRILVSGALDRDFIDYVREGAANSSIKMPTSHSLHRAKLDIFGDGELGVLSQEARCGPCHEMGERWEPLVSASSLGRFVNRETELAKRGSEVQLLGEFDVDPVCSDLGFSEPSAFGILFLDHCN
jgi:hypothetical protein